MLKFSLRLSSQFLDRLPILRSVYGDVYACDMDIRFYCHKGRWSTPSHGSSVEAKYRHGLMIEPVTRCKVLVAGSSI